MMNETMRSAGCERRPTPSVVDGVAGMFGFDAAERALLSGASLAEVLASEIGCDRDTIIPPPCEG